jgi:hypothetical protein
MVMKRLSGIIFLCLLVSCKVTDKEVQIVQEQHEYPMLKLLRSGVAVRKHNDDNVYSYQIPGLVITNNGTLLASYDVRRNSRRDLQGNIDIGISRSTDGGQTWHTSNPAYTNTTECAVVQLDNGATWPEKYWLLLDEGSGSGYSCLTGVDNDHIGILYESSQADTVFQKINIKEILK